MQQDGEAKAAEGREMLRKHFSTLSPEQQMSEGWEKFWQSSITPWDRDGPNPAFVEALEKHEGLLGSPWRELSEEKRIRKKALVPGCGRGYDVLLLASLGYDAYGLDSSPTAIEEAHKLLRDEGKVQRYPMKNIQNGRGEGIFLAASFFDTGFLEKTHSAAVDLTFDLIYDYTFLCALDPSMRPKWAERMSQLLSPSGHLICMEYPLGKAPKLGGPPHGLESGLYEQLLNKPGQTVAYDLSGSVCEDRSGEETDDALVKIGHWTPEQALESQRGKIMVSVWRHWQS